MPRKKGETNQQWMERLQKFRADEMMQRTRAAVTFCNAANSEASKMNAFLALFHPEVEAGSLAHIQLMQSAREKDSRR